MFSCAGRDQINTPSQYPNCFLYRQQKALSIHYYSSVGRGPTFCFGENWSTRPPKTDISMVVVLVVSMVISLVVSMYRRALKIQIPALFSLGRATDATQAPSFALRRSRCSPPPPAPLTSCPPASPILLCILAMFPGARCLPRSLKRAETRRRFCRGNWSTAARR